MTDVIYLAGTERSGTNYLQWLFKENFKRIIVITLYKHYPPRDIISKIDWKNFSGLNEQLQKEARQFARETATKGRGLPPFAFVSNDIQPPTLNRKSQEIEDAVYKSLEEGSLKFLINVKNPYGWHLSFSKHWKKIKFPTSMNHWQNVYSKWAVFHDNHPDISHIVRHEDMLRDFKKYLSEIETKFNLLRKNDDLTTVTGVLSTTTAEKKAKFTRAKYFMNEEYINDLQKNSKEELRECRKVLDKSLVERFGYKIL